MSGNEQQTPDLMPDKQKNIWLQRRRRVSEIIEVGASDDIPSRCYDFAGTLILLLNVAVTVLYTFDEMELCYGSILLLLESVTVAFFAVDYCLRLWTAQFIRPNLSEGRALWKYVTSMTGLIDLLSFLPYYLPVFFPAGAAVFRMFRVVRIFRLFQINAYYDSLNVITEVITSKAQQLVSSVFILLVLMVASSLAMYSVEHEAQPEVFRNAFSGFVDQYSRLKKISEYAQEEDIHFIKVNLKKQDSWVGREIQDLQLPHGVIMAMIRRGRENIVPRGNVTLKVNDTIILGAEALRDDKHIDLKEIVLLKHSPWNGVQIRDLDISQQTIIVMIKRNNMMLVPKGDLVLLEGDHVILYTQERMSHASVIQI